MFEYDESLEQPVASWLQRVVGAALAVAVLGITWVTRAGLTSALTGRLAFGAGSLALVGILFLAWCGLVAVRLLSGDYGRRSLMPAWLFILVGIMFGIVAVVLLVLAFIGHLDVGADSVLGAFALALGSIYYGKRSRSHDASRP